MPSLLSGSRLRKGGSGEFLSLAGAMPQLPDTTTTSTGFTLITDKLLQTRYASSLGNIEFYQSQLYSNMSTGTITILATGTDSISYSTASGTLVVTGGVGIGGNMVIKDDINVNELAIGQGYNGHNNIVVRGTATLADDDGAGQNSIAIGYDVLQGLSTAYRSIAIGRYALSTGTYVTDSIAIGDSALQKLGCILDIPVSAITGATQSNPVIISAPNHKLPSGSYVNIHDVVGMTELTTQSFYISAISSSTIGLYNDSILSYPIDGTNWSNYINSGTVNRVLLQDNNIAIGQGSGSSLIDGTENFLFGNRIAKNLTTGSYNFFAGRSGVNITNGSNIISINGSNLVDGVDNQINLGSVLYYNGKGFTNFNSNIEFGLGDESTSSTTGAVTVIGGVGVTGNINIGGSIDVRNQINSTSIQLIDTVLNSTKTTATSVVQHLIDSYSLSNYRSSKYFVQIDEGTASTARVQVSEITLLATNTGTAMISEYGTLSSNGVLGSFSKNVTNVNGNWTVSLYFTPSDAIPKTIKVLRTAITV